MSSLAIQLRAANKDRVFLGILGLALLALMLDVALLYWKLPAIGANQDVIALHYNVFFGVDRTGSWKMAFIAPAFGAVCLAVNFMLAVWFHATERFMSRTLAGAALVVNILLFAGSLFVILANL